MDKDKMFDEIAAYINHLTFAYNCLDAYMSLHNNVEKHNDVLNKAPGFFTITQYALSKCMILEFAKLFKKASSSNKKERTIYKLFNIAKNSKDVFSNIDVLELCATAEGKLATEFNEIIWKLECRRDNDLTHNDHKYFSGEINPAEENYISPTEFETLYNFGMEFCNELLVALDVERKVDLLFGANDLEDFLNEYSNLLYCKISSDGIY